MQSLNIVLQVHIQQIILHHLKYQIMYAHFEHIFGILVQNVCLLCGANHESM